MVTAFPPSGTPYVTPDQLQYGLWPLAVDFTTLPPGTNVTATQKTSALTAVCMSATSQAVGYLNQPLHAVLNTEQLQGPDWRVTVNRSTGEARVLLSRWPVSSITGVQVAPAGVYPPQWTVVPAGSWRAEYPIIGRFSTNTPGGSGEGGQSILVAPGYVTWWWGRNGCVVQVTYTHGWPHTSLTAPATAGAATLTVGDVTAWAPFTAGAPGAEGTVYDPLGGQEPVSVLAASAAAGPGVLTLAAPLAYAHNAGVMVSALPSDVLWATAQLAGAEALTRGANAMVNQAAPGRPAGGNAKAELKAHAWHILDTFKKAWQ